MQLHNRNDWPDKPAYGARERAILQLASSSEPLALLQHCPNHAITDLHPLTGLARKLELDQVLLKDESERLGLGSFKALGGVYAVMQIVRECAEQRIGRRLAASELLDAEIRSVVSKLTFTCATDGNHGRAVAAGARLLGARAVIFLPRAVAEDKISGIANRGAEIVDTGLDYDDAVAEAARQAEKNDWILVSDTSASADDRIPRLIMHGYTVMVTEIIEQMRGAAPPTHVFLQGGVGGLAAAVAGCFADWLGHKRPTVIVVEPESANCLQASAVAGRAKKIDHLRPTRMAMLECGEPSACAWPILERHADFFLDLPDDALEPAIAALADPAATDPKLDIGDSGLAGLAGLIAIASRPDWRERVRLDRDSRVLVFGTEGTQP